MEVLTRSKYFLISLCGVEFIKHIPQVLFNYNFIMPYLYICKGVKLPDQRSLPMIYIVTQSIKLEFFRSLPIVLYLVF